MRFPAGQECAPFKPVRERHRAPRLAAGEMGRFDEGRDGRHSRRARRGAGWEVGVQYLAAFLPAGREGCEVNGRSPASAATLRGGNAVAHPQKNGVKNTGAGDTSKADNVSHLWSDYYPDGLRSVFGSKKAPSL